MRAGFVVALRTLRNSRFPAGPTGNIGAPLLLSFVVVLTRFPNTVGGGDDAATVAVVGCG